MAAPCVCVVYTTQYVRCVSRGDVVRVFVVLLARTPGLMVFGVLCDLGIWVCPILCVFCNGL